MSTTAKFIFGAVMLLLVSLGLQPQSANAQSSNGMCMTTFDRKTWSDATKDYKLVQIIFNPTTHVNHVASPDSGDQQWLQNSWSCAQAPGSINKSNGEFDITAADSPLRFNNAANDRRRPVAAYLGVRLGTGQDVVWTTSQTAAVIPSKEFVPPVIRRSQGAHAGFVDDGGRASIGPSPTSMQQVLCANYSVTWSPYPDPSYCGEISAPTLIDNGYSLLWDGTSTGGYRGAGYLFTDAALNALRTKVPRTQCDAIRADIQSSTGVAKDLCTSLPTSGDDHWNRFGEELTPLMERDSTGHINRFYTYFEGLNTRQGGFEVSIFVTFSYLKNDNNIPPGSGTCPNYPGSTVSYYENGTAPANLLSSNYSGVVTVDGITVANVTASTGSVPLASMAQFMDANIHAVATTGSVTHAYVVRFDNPATPLINEYQTGSITNGFTVSPNPWPSTNIGCYSRYFDLSNFELSNGDLLPDEEEPDRYETNGYIRSELRTDGEVNATYPLKVLATPRITVTGPIPYTPSEVQNFPFGNVVSKTDGRTYNLEEIINPLNPTNYLRTAWSLKNPLVAGDTYCSVLRLEKVVGEMDVFGVPIPGKITLDNDSSDGGCEKVVDRPFMKSFNNDVRAHTIKAWTRYPGWTGTNGEGYRGSSSQFAAFIMNGGTGGLAATSDAVTKGFYTASQRSQTGPPPCAGVGLVIANPGNCPSADLSTAGVMAGTMPAATKWWDLTIPTDASGNIALTPNSTQTITTSTLVNAATAKDSDGFAYFAHGQSGGSCPAGGGRNSVGGKSPAQCFTLTGASIDDKSRATFYINGDVQITGNITYKNCANDCTYASKDDMPFFTVIAKGSIFIDKAVTQLDGLYIALNNTAIGSDQFYAPGTIYTCTSGFKVPLETGFDAASVLAGCGNKLKVNGALIADQGVEFWRRTNSLRDSRKTDASTIIGGTNAAAEEINFIPELLLSRPAFIEQSQRFDIDTFTGLPPIF